MFLFLIGNFCGLWIVFVFSIGNKIKLVINKEFELKFYILLGVFVYLVVIEK